MGTVQKACVAAACTAALVGLGATSATAGEVTGNYEGGEVIFEPDRGRDLPFNAESFCAFSGQNDGFHDPLRRDPGEVNPTRVQSYGQVVKAGGKAFAPSPGEACNPTRGFAE